MKGQRKRLPQPGGAPTGAVDKESSSTETQSAHETASTTRDSGSGLAGASDANLAADAIAFLRRGAAADAGVGGTATEIERQACRLAKWARQSGFLLVQEFFDGLERYPYATAEHEVFYRPADDLAVKRTYAGTFGVTPHGKGHQTAATPLFYLQRLQLMNEVFGAGLRLEGVSFGQSLLIGQKGKQPSIVVSQPWIQAADPDRPHPSEAEIEMFMRSLGFEPLAGAYFGWCRAKDGVRVVDARVDNFIQSADGVVPIDVVVFRQP